MWCDFHNLNIKEKYEKKRSVLHSPNGEWPITYTHTTNDGIQILERIFPAECSI